MGNYFARRRVQSYAIRQARKQCDSCHGCAIGGGPDIKTGVTGAAYGTSGAIAGGAGYTYGIGGGIGGGLDSE